jgi:hypothetical protein
MSNIVPTSSPFDALRQVTPNGSESTLDNVDPDRHIMTKARQRSSA